jgi:4-carboxymuconolactone decarboxylase
MRHHEHISRVIRITVFITALVLGGGMVAGAQDRMPRIPDDELTAEQRQAIADFKAARGADISGPFIAMLPSPEVMTRARAMGDYLRYHSALPPRLSEFVILLTASEWMQEYEWGVHLPVALKAGIAKGTADAIAARQRPPAMSDDEAALYDFCTELQRSRRVTDATYARARERFGDRGVVDIVGIVGYYTLLAMQLNTFQTPPPQDAPPTPFAR